MSPLESYRRFRPDFANLIDPRFYSIEWLDQGVASGAAAVFGNDLACIVAEIRQYPSGAKDVHGLVAAGDLPTIVELIEHAERWGAREGAVVATIASREGWARVLESKGYRPFQVEVRKELRDGA